MPPRTPEARHALVAEVEDAFRDVHEVVHLERDVVEAGLRPSDERELMVDLVAAEEHHVVAVPVAFLEAEDVLVERVRAVDVGGPDDDVAEIERLHVAVAVVLAHLVVAPVELDGVPVRIAQAQVALRPGAVRRPRHLLSRSRREGEIPRPGAVLGTLLWRLGLRPWPAFPPATPASSRRTKSAC